MTTQPAPPAATPRLLSATPTRLTTWVDCPRRYRFAYVDRPPPPKGPPWAHLCVGAAIHAALAGWWRLPVGQRTPSAAAGLLRQEWQPEGFRDAAQAAQWRERAAAMVQRYAATVDGNVEPVGVERTVSVRTTRTLALSGRVDRIDERGGELVVVDYKTGRGVPSADEARGSLALAIYAAAAAATLNQPCVQVELHHLPSGAVVRATHTPDSLKRHLDRAKGIAAEITAAEIAAGDGDRDAAYPTRPGPQCAWCDFSASCPDGDGVRRAEPWAGLAPDLDDPTDELQAGLLPDGDPEAGGDPPGEGFPGDG